VKRKHNSGTISVEARMRYEIAQDPTLAQIQTAIVEAVSPDKIILFGSRARGEVTAHSDYDLFVIKDDIQNEREISRQINYRLLHEDLAQAVDIVVASAETWHRNINTIGMIYKTINEEGITIYG
jgi:uncharacterized protein